MDGLFVAVLVAVVGVAGWIAWSFNRLVALRNRLAAAWGNVDVLLKRRADLIPNLVEVVRGYMGYEEGTLTRVTAARADAMGTPGTPEHTADRARAENELAAGVRQLFALVEAYPDLKASESILDLQRQLAVTEDDIASARRYYNAVVRDMNTLRETFPDLIVARIFNFKPGEYFELTDVSQREAPSADLRGEA